MLLYFADQPLYYLTEWNCDPQGPKLMAMAGWGLTPSSFFTLQTRTQLQLDSCLPGEGGLISKARLGGREGAFQSLELM